MLFCAKFPSKLAWTQVTDCCSLLQKLITKSILNQQQLVNIQGILYLNWFGWLASIVVQLTSLGSYASPNLHAYTETIKQDYVVCLSTNREKFSAKA